MKRIILHHSFTKDSETVSWGIIRRYHTNTMRFSDIGYHFGIENLRGEVEILMGRMPDKMGAHCTGFNSDSIGICFVGNFDDDEPPKDVWNKGVDLVRWLTSVYGKGVEVVGHNELNQHKSCPGKYFYLDKFRKDVFF